MRWHSASRGEVEPTLFVALAEESGLISQLGHFALKTACYRLQAWEEQGLDDVVISVNVSAQQLTDPGFVAQVSSLIASTGISPARLELELTESAIMNASLEVRKTLQGLRDHGVSLALDDFGTGYSSLACLEMLDFDTIKLDRSFVRKLAAARKDPQYAVAIIRAVLEIANTLDISVIAEGIETREQFELFRALGCPLVQGYYFGHAMPAEDVAALLQKPSLEVAHLQPHVTN